MLVDISPQGAFGPYLHESNTRLGALQVGDLPTSPHPLTPFHFSRILTPFHAWALHLTHSHTCLSRAVQAKALERLLIYMRSDRGGRVCDQVRNLPISPISPMRPDLPLRPVGGGRVRSGRYTGRVPARMGPSA